jgi:hypothetical protein
LVTMDETWFFMTCAAFMHPNTCYHSLLNRLTDQNCHSHLYKTNYRIFRPIPRALYIQKRSEIVKNEPARYTLEKFPTDNARVICTKKDIGKYGKMY